MFRLATTPKLCSRKRITSLRTSTKRRHEITFNRDIATTFQIREKIFHVNITKWFHSQTITGQTKLSSKTNSGLKETTKFNPRPQAEHKKVFEKHNLSQDEWYQVSLESLDEQIASIVKKEYKGSLYLALCAVFPELQWHIWKFKHENLPRGYWKSTQTTQKFFDDLGSKIGIKTLDDWYDKLSAKLVEDAGLSFSKGSVSNILMAAYPNHNWTPWKFTITPYGFWKSKENQRQYLDWLGKQIGVNTLDDWYPRTTRKLFEDNYGAALLNAYKGSPVNIVTTVYSEHKWIPWKFNSVPVGFWKSVENQRWFFDWLGKQVGVEKLDDWYEKLSRKIVDEHQGGMLMNLYNGSVISAVQAIYPEHNWIPWKFKGAVVPQGFWKSDAANQRAFFDDLGKQLGVQNLDDWYDKLTDKAIRESGGQGLIERNFLGTVSATAAALIAAYPEHHWIPWKFNSIPKRYWKSTENQRKYFDWLGKELGVSKLDDWYQKLSYKAVVQNCGTSFLEHQESPAIGLMNAYPEHTWFPWKFNCVPTGYWKSTENQRKYFDWLGKEIGIKELDDWYDKISEKLLRENYGITLLTWHKYSPAAALMAVYPEHKWVVWKFKSSPHGVWDSKDNVSKFLAELSEKLSIQTLDDWYRVDTMMLTQFGANSLVTKFGGLFRLLKEHYPHHPWDPKRFQQTGKKAQRWLAVTLKKMFPNEEILEDYLHPKVSFVSSNRPLQLDVFIPSKSLAFEYQGLQHFQEVGVFSPSRIYQQRDEEKRALCASNNIKLIEVPYWWNRTQESLQEMIK